MSFVKAVRTPNVFSRISIGTILWELNLISNDLDFPLIAPSRVIWYLEARRVDVFHPTCTPVSWACPQASGHGYHYPQMAFARPPFSCEEIFLNVRLKTSTFYWK